MLKTLRRTAAFCALLALSLSFAETARASVCHRVAEATAGHARHDAGAPADSDPAPGCPEHSPGVPCTSCVSLPATAGAAFSAQIVTDAAVALDAVVPHFLDSSTVFHPPRS